MAFVPLPNTIQANMKFLLDGQNVEWVFHYTTDPPFNLLFQEASTEIGAALITAWVDNLRSRAPTAMSLQSVYLSDQEDENGEVQVYTVGLPLAGSSGGERTTNHSALVITKLTQARGRSFRGRTYLCGFTEADISGNSWVTAAIEAAVDFMEEIRVITGVTYTSAMAVASRYANNQPRVTGVLTPVTAFRANPVVASQRRRLPGRGG